MEEENKVISEEVKAEESNVKEEVQVVQENKRKGKKIVSKILNIFLWVIVLSWMAICLVDFFHVRNSEEPQFCLKSGTTKYDDGTVDWCNGLGYKVYIYKRDSFRAYEYGPFWSKDRSEEIKK